MSCCFIKERERVFRKMIQSLQIESLEITWLTILHYCTLFPSLPSLHLLSSHIIYFSPPLSKLILSFLLLFLSCLLCFRFFSSTHIVSSLLFWSCLILLTLHCALPLFPPKSFDLTWFPILAFTPCINSSQLTSIPFISFWFAQLTSIGLVSSALCNSSSIYSHYF